MPRAEAWAVALLACALLAGCNDTSDLAPASPSEQWQPVAENATGPAGVPDLVMPLDPELQAQMAPAAIAPAHAYSLCELIDVAERRNQTTRIAWEQARQAAINVGIAQASYLPALSVNAIAGYEHLASPFPGNLVPQGYITANSEEVLPEIAVNYLLFGFGRRSDAVQAAQQLSTAANADLTTANQTLILSVASAYFALDGANAALQAARQALQSAQSLQNSAEAMAAHGVGTIVAVDLARRGTAQSVFDVASATSAQHDATYSLLAAMDLPPTTALQVQDDSAQPLAPDTAGTVDKMMNNALAQRPDLLADLSQLRAGDAGIALARDNFMPTITLSGNVQGNIGRIGVDNQPYENVNEPQEGVFLNFNWPIYQGGLLQNQLRLAQSRQSAAEDALQLDRDQALRQVASAYDHLDTSLTQYRAAVALQAAAQTAFDAASASFAQGVGNITDATSAQAGLASAGAAVAQAHSQSLIDAATLAFATGSLTSSEALGSSQMSP